MMVHHDISNQSRRSSFRRGGDDGAGGGLKAMMSNLLPSLDASMDSHFSKDFSHSEVTATTAAHTSTTSSYSFGGTSTTSSYSFGHDDLGDSAISDDASMSASTRIRAGSIKVKKTLKKAFNKMAKKSTGSGTTANSNSKRTSGSGKKKDKDKKSSSKNKKGRLQLEDTRNKNKKNKGSNDDELDSVADPPTICSAALEYQSDEEEEEEEEEEEDDDEYEREKPRRTRSRSRPSMRSSKTAQQQPQQQRSKRRKSRSRSRSESESSESGRLQHPRASIRNSSNSGGVGGRNKSLPPKSKSYDGSRAPNMTAIGGLIAMGGGDEPPINNRKKRSSRRGGGSGKSPTRTSMSGGGSSRRMPPKAKSYDSSSRPPALTAMGNLIAMQGGENMENVRRPDMPRRSSSFASASGGRERGERNQRNSVRGSNVTAQAALPKPTRPSISGKRNSSIKHVSGSSSHRRRSGAGDTQSNNNNNNNGKSIPRPRSLKHVDRASSAEGAESHHSHNSSSGSKKSMRRSKSFSRDQLNTDFVKPTKKGPGRAKSFDGTTPLDVNAQGRGGGEERRRSISRTREAKRKSMPAASQQERECGYNDQPASSKGSADPEPVFSLEDHFGGDGGTGTELTKFDEISIDTCSTNGVQDKNNLNNNSNNINNRASNRSRRGRRSKSRSKSPSGSGRRSSTSRSPSRSRRGEGSEREQSVSRRPSSRSCSRSRRQSSSERARSKSRSRRQSSSERARSKSRSRRQSSSERGGEDQDRSRSRSSRRVSRSSSIKPTKKERGRSKSAARQRRSISHQQAKRPSIQRRRSSSRSRRESDARTSMKQYETLSKEDFMVPEDKSRTAKGRRPRSLSRSKKSPKTRVSRSLSTTRKGKKDQQEGIGDYLQRQQPERSPRDEDTNSQSTGSKTTGSAEVTYATPSWMWNSTSTSFSSAFFSAHNSDGWPSGFDGPMKEESNKSNSSGSDGQSLFQTSFTSNSNSYDAGSEMSTPTPRFPKTTTGSGNGFSPPLMTADSTGLNNNNSTSSLSASATPATKAKHFYGKALKKEQEEIRAQSQSLFQTAQSAGFGDTEEAF